MQLNIGTRQYRTKPKQFASINNDVIGNIVDLSLEEIIDRVGNKGYTFTRAIMRGARTKENFIKQRFLVLDFDEGMSEEKFKRRCTELRLSYHCEELSTRELEMFDWVLKKQGIGQSGAQCIVTTHELFILKGKTYSIYCRNT